jgi:hypothetical protein
MSARKRKGTGRVTPKGTKNPAKPTKARRVELPPTAAEAPPHELAGKAGKQSHKVSRPITHNRGNR